MSIFSSIQCSSAGQNPVWEGGGQSRTAAQAGAPRCQVHPQQVPLSLQPLLYPCVFPAVWKRKNSVCNLPAPKHLRRGFRESPSLARTTYWFSVSLNSRSCPFYHRLSLDLAVDQKMSSPTNLCMAEPSPVRGDFLQENFPVPAAPERDAHFCDSPPPCRLAPSTLTVYGLSLLSGTVTVPCSGDPPSLRPGKKSALDNFGLKE